ncbi:MAG: antibiotic biosynthesis monooxygenase [Candidatus Korobacteraceae bacterium]|jgi:heme-degrading monooxygenase HmoA
MFTRVVECTCKPGKAKELCQTVEDKVLPIMRKLQGFKDEIVLISQSDPNRVLAISFWNSRQDGERYQREQFPKVTETIRNLCTADPQVETYDVALSTSHQITTKAA